MSNVGVRGNLHYLSFCCPLSWLHRVSVHVPQYLIFLSRSSSSEKCEFLITHSAATSWSLSMHLPGYPQDSLAGPEIGETWVRKRWTKVLVFPLARSLVAG